MFNQAAITQLTSNIKSGAMVLGTFDQVLTHEPKSAPQHNTTLSIWWTNIKPSKVFSGLTSVSGIVTFQHRIYINMFQKPEDQIEANLMTATSTLISEYANEFSFGGTVMAVDLLGMDSPGLSASTGYVNIDNRLFRVSNLIVPIVIDNLWTETA